MILLAPILGDLKYSGAGPMVESRSAPRIYLHMAELELKVTFLDSVTCTWFITEYK
jgi:23S rRNA-/tRNA-specific pseudouridylate synthase